MVPAIQQYQGAVGTTEGVAHGATPGGDTGGIGVSRWKPNHMTEAMISVVASATE